MFELAAIILAFVMTSVLLIALLFVLLPAARRKILKGFRQ